MSLAIVLLLSINTGGPSETRKTWLPVVKAASDHYDMDWRLLDALIRTESGWNIDALSHAGAIGLAQLMPGTAKELGVIDPWDPGQNIWGAALYLKRLGTRFCDWQLILAAYNAGPGRVGRCNCVPNIEETQNYVKTVLTRWTDKSKQLPSKCVVSQI